MLLLLLCLISLLPSAFAFLSLTVPRGLHATAPLRLSASPENETPEEQAARMNMVRQLQQAFYQNEDKILPPEKGSTIIKDLPLWRVQWTELPGFQNTLNVHVAHYTNMFQKIMYSDAKQKYFGHIYLPGGSENLDNPEYRLEEGTKSTIFGVLMQIADYKQMDDGRFVMIVQALEKFRIVQAQRHHSPYAIATVEILPDYEIIEAFEDDHDNVVTSQAKAVEEAFRLHPYEVRSVTMEDCMIGEGETEGISVSPLSNYDANYKVATKEGYASAVIDMDDSVFEMEQKVWIKLDEMLKLLQQLVDPSSEHSIPIPTQILGLLPLQSNAPWPEGFSMEKYATKLEIEKILVGTFSQSPFVRVDNVEGYSPLRRAQRLSFVIWVLMDSVIALADDNEITRQDILEMDNTEDRLEAGLAKLELICNVISELLKNK